ncbi:MAG: amidohydrolase family protein [Acidimicrobiia bacterium]
MSLLWANSGDSHIVEPDDLFTKALPADLAERMPRSVKDPDGSYETVYVDGQEFRRRMPRAGAVLLTDEEGKSVNERAPGANDVHLRLKDLDSEGIWAEVTYPSIGIWTHSIRDPKLLAAGCAAINDWAFTYQDVSARLVCTATIPLLDVADAVAEIKRTSAMGYKAAYFSVAPPPGVPSFVMEAWEPVWSALEEEQMVLGIHIGTEPHDADTFNGAYHRGPGGALMNYFETTFGGQRATAQLISAGVLERHPGLKVLISEGGATWGPFVADRLDEGYRQHLSAVRPRLQKLPSEYLYSQVYASFQHDRSAVAACTAMGWQNVMWGSDYPHLEGTFGHSQKTLHELFDDVDAAASERIRLGAFAELFPHVPAPPA